jgi:transposase, IS5 family
LKSAGKTAQTAVCDRGYQGPKKVGDTQIILPAPPLKKDNRYQRDKKRKRCQRRAAIEPIIGHLKSDYRLARNFLKGTSGDLVNGLMTAMAWNLNLWMRTLFVFIFALFRARQDRYRSIYPYRPALAEWRPSRSC